MDGPTPLFTRFSLSLPLFACVRACMCGYVYRQVNVREIEEAMARLEEMNLLSDEEVEEENQRLLKQQQLRQSHSDAEGGSSGASGSSTSPPP